MLTLLPISHLLVTQELYTGQPATMLLDPLVIHHRGELVEHVLLYFLVL